MHRYQFSYWNSWCFAACFLGKFHSSGNSHSLRTLNGVTAFLTVHWLCNPLCRLRSSENNRKISTENFYLFLYWFYLKLLQWWNDHFGKTPGQDGWYILNFYRVDCGRFLTEEKPASCSSARRDIFSLAFWHFQGDGGDCPLFCPCEAPSSELCPGLGPVQHKEDKELLEWVQRGAWRWSESWSTSVIRKGWRSHTCWTWRGFREDLIANFQYLKGACKQEKDQHFTWSNSDRTRGKGLKL